MIKLYALSILFTLSGMAHAQSEQQCLGSGKLAEATAEMMQNGATEESVIETLTEGVADNPKRPKARQKLMLAKQVDIAKYVFTMRPSPAEARATVYKKCMAGGLGHIDWSKHPEAL